MLKRFSAGRLIAILTLLTYFTIGIEAPRKVTDSMRCSITWSEDLNTSDQSDQTV